MSIYECNVLRGDELLEQNPPTRFENAETRSGMGMIIADGIRNSMSLAGLASQLDLFLNTIEIHRSADGVESLNFNDQTPPPDRRLKIDLRTDDRCHATPHFHLIHNNNDTTYDTKDFNRLGGAPVDPETAEMVRRFFVTYGGGKQMEAILNSDAGLMPGNLDRPSEVQSPEAVI